jgi:putative ATP-dependent endonuclease of the OLD family
MAPSMIERIIIDGYRRFAHLELEPAAGLNVVVGDNESGKSTLLEALALALTGKVNGRWAGDELNPFWFNRDRVRDFFAKYDTKDQIAPPTISIELYFSDVDKLQPLRGVHNSHGQDRPGVKIQIAPNPEYLGEFRAYMQETPPAILPVEFYHIDWRDFTDKALQQRPKELTTSFIDSRTIRSTSGVDHHTRELLSKHLNEKERARISLVHRKSKQEITEKTLADINARIAASSAVLHDRPLGLQMDQSARTSWETGVVPQVDDIPFAMAGQGQQAAIKVALAMNRSAGVCSYVLIEEPENHLSHTSLTRLINRIEGLTTEDQQVFITTHSSYVLNRLGLDRLILLHDGRTSKLTQLGDGTVAYFRKLAGYDTLRLVLAEKVALVEGPSDAIVLQRAFMDATGMQPVDAGVDIISMDGLTFKRALEVCACLDRQAIGLQDNDSKAIAEVRQSVAHLLATGKRELFVSDPANGPTLEPQIIAVNEETALRRVLRLTPAATLATWMHNNKTEAALRILDAKETIYFPEYINRAVELLK